MERKAFVSSQRRVYVARTWTRLPKTHGPYQISLTPSTLSYTVTEDQDTITHITCSANCRPGCNYRWFKNGTTYAGTDATLSLGQAVRAKTGSYRCQPYNKHGDDNSSTVSVNVQYKASIESFTANSGSGSVIIDESTPVTLTCQVDSNPRSTIRLMNGSQERKMEGNSLSASTIVRTSCRQRGNYSCTATNNIGTEANSVVQLAVKCYPRVDETSNVQDKYGSSLSGNVTVSVPVLAYPVPTFTWRRNTSTSQDLSGSFIHVSDIITNSVLQVTRIQQEDMGEYTLTAENGVGDPAVFTVTIVPQGPPETPTNLTVRPDGPDSLVVAWKQEFNGGAEQTFTVEYSKDKVTWTVAGTYVESKDKIYQQQTISDLQPSTSYFVKVISRNEFGEKNYSESVSGQTAQADGGPPETPTNLTVRPDGPDSLVVAWKQEFNGGAEQTFTVEYSKDKVTWTVAGTYVESKDKIYQQQTISDLQPSTSYFVKVISRNEFGEKNYSESVSGQTAQADGGSDAGSSKTGVIVGATVGVVLVIILGLGIVVCLVRKGYRCVKLSPDTEVKNERSNQDSRRNSGDDTLPGTDHNHYSDLNREGDKPTYTELKTYVNTEFGSPQGTDALTMNVYDGLQENSSVPYETLNVHTYANT